MSDNMVNKVCVECGKEFQISKFQPYIIWCKEHRKGKQKVIKGTSKKSKKIAKREMKSHGFGCPECENVLDKSNMGLFICPKCHVHYWVFSNGFYRTFHLPYKLYYKGNFVANIGDIGQPTASEAMEAYNGSK